MQTSQAAFNSMMDHRSLTALPAARGEAALLQAPGTPTVTPIVYRTAESLAETLIEMAEAAVAEDCNNVRLVAGFRVLFVLAGDRRLDANMFYFVYSGVDNKGNSLISEPMPLSVCVQLLQQLTATY